MIVACVRVGSKYSVDYVYRLRAGVARHLPLSYRFVCLSDRPQELDVGNKVDVSADGLPGWWAKMRLLDTSWRIGQRVIYFDLDTVIVGDLSPLATLDVPFGICASFTQRAGHSEWPCRYGSAVMTIAPTFGGDIWQEFQSRRDHWMTRADKFGDQMAIQMICERLGHVPTLLQDALPAGFFLGYRDLPRHQAPPKAASVVVFAGSHKPDNTRSAWARKAWAA